MDRKKRTKNQKSNKNNHTTRTTTTTRITTAASKQRNTDGTVWETFYRYKTKRGYHIINFHQRNRIEYGLLRADIHLQGCVKSLVQSRTNPDLRTCYYDQNHRFKP